MLIAFDQLLSVCGLILLFVWIMRFLTRFPSAPSIRQPSHAFREDAVLLVTLTYALAAIALSALMKSMGQSTDPILTGIVVNNGSQLCGAAACLVFAARRVPGGIGTFFWGEADAEDQHSESFWPEAFCLAVIAVGVCPLIRNATAALILRIAPGFDFKSHPALDALGNQELSGLMVVALWVGAAVVAPVAEEMFFRGILQNFLSGATRKAGFATVLAAGAFALVHFSQPHAVPALFFLGILLGTAYARSGNLVVPIVIHAVFNLKTLVWETAARHAG